VQRDARPSCAAAYELKHQEYHCASGIPRLNTVLVGLKVAHQSGSEKRSARESRAFLKIGNQRLARLVVKWDTLYPFGAEEVRTCEAPLHNVQFAILS
jgi:hypothetical protein